MEGSQDVVRIQEKTNNTWTRRCGHIYVNELNTFFARFEQNNFSVEQNEVMHTIRNRKDEQVVIRQEAVMRELKRIRISKATGPDAVPAKALKCCAEMLVLVLTQLFQDSITQGEVPQIWKLTKIKPIRFLKFIFQNFLMILDLLFSHLMLLNVLKIL